MMSWDLAFEKKLLAAESYRKFLAIFFESKDSKSKPRKLSYQGFANRAGFSSKSFIADVIAERKRITPISFEKVILGLALNKSWSDYFKCLVAIEEDDFVVGKMTKEYYSARLKELRNQLKNKKKIIREKGKSTCSEVVLSPNFPEVFASLGAIDEGATLEQIEKRSRLSSGQLLKILSDFESVKLVEYLPDTGRYRPIMNTLELVDLNSDSSFEKDFLRSIEKAKNRFKAQTNSDVSLFMTQTFSVNETQLNYLKNELAKIIESFSENSESHDGDAVAEICISFTNNTI